MPEDSPRYIHLSSKAPPPSESPRLPEAKESDVSYIIQLLEEISSKVESLEEHLKEIERATLESATAPLTKPQKEEVKTDE